MSITEFNTFYNKPCKFKMKGGKEIYGVIWENVVNGDRRYYFASSGEYYRLNQDDADIKMLDRYQVDINDVVDAEYLEAV